MFCDHLSQIDEVGIQPREGMCSSNQHMDSDFAVEVWDQPEKTYESWNIFLLSEPHSRIRKSYSSILWENIITPNLHLDCKICDMKDVWREMLFWLRTG
jgi:hypothetical protein